MDYEKKYKEALRQAEEVIKYYKCRNRDEAAIEDLQEIFPELKESEDEMIKKAIISIVAFYPEAMFDRVSVSREDCLAWLEKQESLTIDEEKQGKEDVLWCIKQAKKYAKDENEMGTCWFAEQWLEKQGNKLKEEKTDNANKAEPKFKVGDTIKYVGQRKELAADEYTIKEICNDCYITTFGSKIPFRMQEYYVIVNDTKELKKFETSLPSSDKQQGTPVIDIPFGAKDSELQEASYHIPTGCYAEIQGNMVVIKKGE